MGTDDTQSGRRLHGSSETHRPVPGRDGSATEEETSDARFKGTHRTVLAVGLLVSVALHAAFFLLAPQFQAQDLQAASASLEGVELPPQVEIPPPPEQIARPATPTVSEAEVSEDVTITRTTFEANPVERLPPPPKAGASKSERPTFIPRDVEPRLKNRAQVHKLLRRFYPEPLREANIGGTVNVWVFVDTSGKVEKALVKQASGYEALDAAALKVARRMEFTPALNRDEPIGVWVSQQIRFRVVS